MGAKVKIILDRFWPLFFGIAMGVTYWLIGSGNFAGQSVNTVLQAGLTVSAVAVGFLANLKATMFSMDDRESIQKIRRAGYHNDLVNRLVDAIHFGFVLALLSCVGFFVNFATPPHWQQLFLAAWIALSAASVVAYFRVIHIFKIVLRLP